MHQFAAYRLAYMSSMSIPSGSVPARSIFPICCLSGLWTTLDAHLPLLRTCVTSRCVKIWLVAPRQHRARAVQSGVRTAPGQGLTGACSNPGESLCRCPDLRLKCDPIGGRRPRRAWPHYLVSLGTSAAVTVVGAQRGPERAGCRCTPMTPAGRATPTCACGVPFVSSTLSCAPLVWTYLTYKSYFFSL